LSDHPVVLNNHVDHGPYGNIGLAVEGIEIYMPLASDLMLCAFCPTIAVKLRADLEAAKRLHQNEALRDVMAGKMSGEEMRQFLEAMKPKYAISEEILAAMQAGTPVPAVDVNMDYFNSMQMRHAARFVVSRDGDFALARDINKKYPGAKGGLRFEM
jgi:Protein of unknown function (DUF4238)